jgi:hypothetical protein
MASIKEDIKRIEAICTQTEDQAELVEKHNSEFDTVSKQTKRLNQSKRPFVRESSALSMRR